MFVCILKESETLNASDRHFTLVRIVRHGIGLIKLDDNSELRLAWDRWVYVFPSVKITVDRSRDYVDRLKLIVDAPPEISLKRFADDETDTILSEPGSRLTGSSVRDNGGR